MGTRYCPLQHPEKCNKEYPVSDLEVESTYFHYHCR